MPSVYQTVFGGNLVAPALPTYLSLSISTNTVLGWPLESNITSPVAAEIIDVTATVGSLTIQLSDARQISTGYCALFNNVGANTFTILDANGGTIAAIASGQAWQIYLADNSTLAGTWRVFQYGAGVSSANAAALAGNGLKAITTTLNERIFINAQGSNYSVQVSDRAACIEWTGGAGGTFTSPNPVTAGSDWFCYVKNSGTGVLTFTPASGTIDGTANRTFNPNDSCIVVCDGTNFFTLGFGQSVASSFNFVTISLAGASGTVILSGAQLNRISYKFTGLLAGNTTVQVPASIQQYWVDNETTGAFTLTISAGGVGTTFTVPQANRTILYCDGLNIVNAITGGGVQFGDGTAAAPSITFASDLALGLYKAGADVLGISTAGVQRGTINASGQWALNAAASGSTLTAAGAANAYTVAINGNSTSGQSLGLIIAAGTTAADTALAVLNQPQTHVLAELFGDGHFLLGFNGTTNTVSGSVGGNVVISAPTGGTALAVSGTYAGGTTPVVAASSTGGTGNFFGSFDGTHEALFGTATVGGFVGTFSNHEFDIRTNNTARITVSNAGNITTNTPGSGTSILVNQVGGQNAITITDGTISQSWGNNSSVGYIGTNTAQSFEIVTNAAARVVATSTGNIVVNAPTSGTTLLCNGVANGNAIVAVGSSTAGQSFAGYFAGGTNASDAALQVLNQAQSTLYFKVRGDGLAQAVDQSAALQDVGWRDIPQNLQAVSYQFALSDRGKHIYTSVGGPTYTIPANASVAFPVGTTIVIVNDSGGNVAVAITTDTLVWLQGGSSATGTRTVAASSIVTIMKVAATRWTITGNGIS